MTPPLWLRIIVAILRAFGLSVTLELRCELCGRLVEPNNCAQHDAYFHG